MSGRRKFRIKQFVAFLVCSFLCTLVFSSPGAWAERDGQTRAQLNAGQEQPQTINTPAALGDDKATPRVLDLKVDSPFSLDIKTPFSPINPQKNEVLPTPSASTPDQEAGAALGDSFEQDITVGGISVPCTFTVTDINKHLVKVGSTSNECPAIDKSSSGSLVLPKIVNYEGADYQVSEVGDYAFYNCAKITTSGLDKNKTISCIGNYAYSGCTKLQATGLEANDELKGVGSYAFQGCASLTSTGLQSNNTLTALGDYAFSACSSLTNTGLQSNNTLSSLSRDTFYGCVSLPSTGLASNTTLSSLGNEAFAGCRSLSSTGLESNTTITSCGDAAFQACSSLTSTGLAGNSVLTSLGRNTFSQCDSLRSTGLEENKTLTTLKYGSFCECSALLSTGLDSNFTVRTVGDYAFSQCASLTSTGLAHNSVLTTLGEAVFQGCTSLASTGLQSNNTLTDISRYAFSGCTLLTSTGLGQNHRICSIGDYAFYNCGALGTQATEDTNAGDLVLNEPDDGKTLTIGISAFEGTKYQAFYALCDQDKLSVETGGFTGLPKKLYVPETWDDTSSYSDAVNTFSVADGSLVVMNPLQGVSAARERGTSDAASVSFTVNQAVRGTITNEEGNPLASFSAKADASKPQQKVTINIEKGSGLDASEQKLNISADTGQGTVYPAGALTQTYNTVGGSASCSLAAVNFKIHFDPNGASNCSAYTQDGVSYGSTTLLTNTFTNSGYNFLGWNTQRAGDGIEISNEGLASGLPALEGESLTLYAQWDHDISFGLVVKSSNKNKPLKKAGYVLSAAQNNSSAGIEGLYTNPEKTQPVSWPQMSNDEGDISLYGIKPGIYYLFNTKTPAGYEMSSTEPCMITVDENGNVLVNGQSQALSQNTINIDQTFSHSFDVSSAASLSTSLVQGTGALVLIAAAIVVVRRLRRNVGRTPFA